MDFQDITQFRVKTKLISFIHDYFRVFDVDGNLIAYAQKKGFRLREDMRIFSDASKAHELLSIKTKSIIDFGASYELHDSQTGELLGSFRRSGFKSLLRDHWCIIAPGGETVYELLEDSMLMSMLRRMLSNLIPARYHLKQEGQVKDCQFKQNFNPFLLHYHCSIPEWDNRYDKRLALAMVILLLSIEGKQGNSDW